MEELKFSKKHSIPSSYSDDNDIYDMLTQDSFLMLNKKIISTLGLELATFVTFLVDKQKYYRDNNKLDTEGYFYITNSDLVLYTGIKASRINALKIEALDKRLLLIKKAGIPLKTYYKVDLDKIRNIISNSKSSLELSYDRLLFDENINSSDISCFSISTLESKTYRELRLICKKLKISYSGTDKKENYIEKILNFNNTKEDIDIENIEKYRQKLNPITQFDEIDFSDFNLLNSFSFNSLRLICKKLKIPYSGKNTKKTDLINKIISSNSKLKNNYFSEEFLKLKELILNFKELELSWNSSVEEILYNFYKKHGYKLSYEFLTSNYKNIIENKNSIKNLSGCFISLIKKEQRQLNSNKVSLNKDVQPSVQSSVQSGVNEGVQPSVQSSVQLTIEDFFKLDTYEQLKLEEKAINHYIEESNLDFNSIMEFKVLNENLYYNTLEKYILKEMNI